MDIGENVATTVRNSNCLCDLPGVIDRQHIKVALHSYQRAHQSRDLCPDHYNISLLSKHHYYPTALYLGYANRDFGIKG